MLKPWKVKPAAEDMGLHEGEGTTTNAVGKMVILPSSIANPLRYGITGTAPSLLTATQASLAAYYASSHTPHPVSTLTGRYVAPARAINADLYNKGGFKLPTKIPVPPPVPSTRPGSGPVVVTGTGSGGITRLSLGLCLSGLCLQVALGLL